MGLGLKDYRAFISILLREIEISFGRENIISIALFGSVARGEAHPQSDIDFLVIHKEVPYDPVHRSVRALLKAERSQEYQRLNHVGCYPQANFIFMTPEEISQRPLILLDVMDHGILLKDESSFLQEKLKQLRKKLEELGAEKILLEDGSWAWDLKPSWKPGEVIEITL